MTMTRTGLGFDSHRFTAGEHIVIGGVHIPCDMGIDAHSDGDAVLHALTDALLGAVACGDIGDHFPDNDPKWANCKSELFVRHAMQLVTEKGYSLSNCDITIIADRPKIGPLKSQIIDSIAKMLEAGRDQVSIKAKTSENMGLVSSGKGLAALVSVLVEKS